MEHYFGSPCKRIKSKKGFTKQTIGIKKMATAREKEIRHYLHSKGITCFYHFTRVENIESIRKHGLCSLKTIEENHLNSITNGDPLSISLDKKKNTSGDVHLSFKPNYSMWDSVVRRYLKNQDEKNISDDLIIKTREEKFVLLKVYLPVIFFPKVTICPINSANRYAFFYFSVLKGLENIDWEKNINEAEVLVPNRIPTDYIDFSNYNRSHELDWLYGIGTDYDGRVYLSDGCYLDSNGDIV